jgi:SAM-dependent methyltransferase
MIPGPVADTTASLGTRDRHSHFDETYRGVDVDELVDLIGEWGANRKSITAHLRELTSIHSSWHGLYLDGFAERLPGAKVLELGSGDGTNACIMAALGADVTASDISDESGRIIRDVVARTGLRHLHFEASDTVMEKVRPHSLDFVVGKAFLHHLNHVEEALLLADVASRLADRGEARFFEPAVNSSLLDHLRWMIPVPGRPSSLSAASFRKWQDEDPHPVRDNSSDHYVDVGKRFFESAEVVPLGCLERFYRFLPRSRFQKRYRSWSHRVEVRLPDGLRRWAARSQLIAFRSPRGLER